MIVCQHANAIQYLTLQMRIALECEAYTVMGSKLWIIMSKHNVSDIIYLMHIGPCITVIFEE